MVIPYDAASAIVSSMVSFGVEASVMDAELTYDRAPWSYSLGWPRVLCQNLGVIIDTLDKTSRTPVCWSIFFFFVWALYARRPLTT